MSESRLRPATADAIRDAAAILRAGGLVAFPTETVYGLGANALDADAVSRIFAAKGRPATNPLIVHVGHEEMLRRVVADWPDAARVLAERFWPGPLTLVVPCNPKVPGIVTAGGDTIAVRMPANPVAIELIRKAGVPLAAPSANRSTAVSPTLAEHVLASLGDAVDLILDGGPTANGIESTVVDVTGSVPILLRPGPITLAELEPHVGRVSREATGGIARSPGQMARHYAPRTPVRLVRSREVVAGSVSLLIGGEAGPNVVAMPTDPGLYAVMLYRVLHEEDAKGWEAILIEAPPEGDDWLAVRDRLQRASTV